MAKINYGIFSNPRGSIANVTFSSWKTINYAKKKIEKNTSNSELQVIQRTKFALTLSVLKPITELLRVGWKLYAKKRTAFNAAMSHALKYAISGTGSEMVIDHSKIKVASGTLTGAENGVVAIEDSNIVIYWYDNSGINSAKPTDKSLIAVMNTDNGEAITLTAGAERATGTQTLALPANWSGDCAATYLAFISDDGKEVSDSVYLGQINID